MDELIINSQDHRAKQRLRRSERKPLKQTHLIDKCFVVLLLVSLLNANIFFVALDMPSYASFCSAILCIVILTMYKTFYAGPLFYTLSFSVISYLLFGVINGIAYGHGAEVAEVAYRWIGSFAVTAVAYFYIRQTFVHKLLRRRRSTALWMVWALLAASLSIFCAHWFPDSLARIGWDGNIHRASGVWRNPNESAMVTGVTIAILMFVAQQKNRPGRIRVACIICIPLLLFAGLLTYSKSGIIVFTAIFALAISMFKSVSARLLISIFVVFVVATINFNYSSLTSIMTKSQEQRINQVTEIFISRNVSRDTSSGRYDLWEEGFDKIKKRPIFGHGLGAMDDDQSIDGSKILGSHNTFLVLWGEGGIVPFAGFVTVIILTAYRVYRKRRSPYIFIAISYSLVLITDLMLTQGALLVRYNALGLGLLLGYLEMNGPKDKGLRRVRSRKPIDNLAHV